jgi:hypothetical protein
MTTDLNTAVAALNALTMQALQTGDLETMRRFQQLAFQWSEVAAREIRDRSKRARATKPFAGESA